MNFFSSLPTIRPLNKLLQSFQAALRFCSTQSQTDISTLDDLDSVRKARAWIQAAVVSNEEMAVRGEEVVRLWLSELQELENQASDLLGLYEYELAAQEVRHRAQQTESRRMTGKRKLQQLDRVGCSSDEHSKVGSSTSSLSSPLVDPHFRRVVADGIQKFRERFIEINNDKEALELKEEDGLRRLAGGTADRQPTSSFESEVVIGREEDKNDLIKFLLTSSSNIEVSVALTNTAPVAALVGMGGVGKTTLARCAYNNETVCRQFDIKAWVCLSEHHYDITALAHKILEAFGDEELQGNCPNGSGSHQEGARQLKRKLRAKRFLLVLDDVWDERKELWDDLFSHSLNHGTEGSRIIITTRNQTVADHMQATKCLPVNRLSWEDGWSLFQLFAFGDHQNQMHHHGLVSIGKKIAQKCEGLPLALKVLGLSLRHGDQRDEEQAWKDVLESDLWEPHTWEEGKQVLGPLILSYLHLPAHLKACFKICSVFPKSYAFHEPDVIILWMAHELVDDYDEEVGKGFIVDLVSRSLFQYYHSKHGERYLLMHDLIHDVARYFSGDDNVFHVVPGNGENRKFYIPSTSQHAYIKPASGTTVQYLQNTKHVHDVSCLRTLMVFSKGLLGVQGTAGKSTVCFNGLRTLSSKVPPDDDLLQYLHNSKNLRVLYLYNPTSEMILDPICRLYNLRTLLIQCDTSRGPLILPDSIGDLTHLVHFNIELVTAELPETIGRLTNLHSLRVAVSEISYLPNSISRLVNLKELDLSNTKISALSEAIGNLRNLQLLNLRFCYYLHKLPKNLANLTNLQVLDLDNTPRVCYLPVGFGRLKKLLTLPIFRPSPSSETAHYAGIAELRDLVNISDKLSILHLSNVGSPEDALQANLENKGLLRSLELEWGDHNTCGTCRDDGDESAKNQGPYVATLNENVLENLRPHVHLEKLSITGWRGVRLTSWLGNVSFDKLYSITLVDLCNCISLWPLNQLPSLKVLALEKMPALTSTTEQQAALEYFPVLVGLFINHCTRLVALPDMPLLKRLHLGHSESLACVPPLPMLEDLTISCCPRIDSLPSDCLPFLKKLTVDCCKTMACPFSSLQELCISGCRELVNLPDIVSSVKKMKLHKCDSLKCIPLYRLTKLEEVCVDECKNLERMEFEETAFQVDQQHQPHSSNSNIYLTSLKSLIIEDCPKLRFSDSTLLPSSLQKLEVSKCPWLQEWCSAHRQSKLAHLPEISEWNIFGAGVTYSIPDN